jgi:F0F1-type ATP synthase membrane subunit c/vacuolar-type H+-ATPase subunit K
MTEDDPARRPLRAAWRVALYAFLLTVLVGIAVGLAAAVASGSIDRDPAHAGELFGRALFPFVLAVTIAAYVIQRSRIAASQPGPPRR